MIDLAFCGILPGTTPEASLATLRACGFDGIELWPDTLNQYPLLQWRGALAAEGMQVFQLCPYFNFIAGDKELRASREQLRAFIYAARELGCRRLRVFTGPPWGDGVVGATAATPAQWQAAIAGLQEFCAEARRHNLELCLECHEGSLMEDSPNALRLLHAVGAENLTVNLQLPLVNEPPQTSLEQLGDYTNHIHIHNWTGGFGEGSLTFLDEGAVQWEPIIRHLVHERGRRLCLSVEHPDHGGRHDPAETARRDGAYLTNLRRRSSPPPAVVSR